MGFIAFPFIACFIIALFGWPFLLMFYFHSKKQQTVRMSTFDARLNVENSYSRMCMRALESGQRLTDKDYERMKKDAVRIYGKGLVTVKDVFG